MAEKKKRFSVGHNFEIIRIMLMILKKVFITSAFLVLLSCVSHTAMSQGIQYYLDQRTQMYEEGYNKVSDAYKTLKMYDETVRNKINKKWISAHKTNVDAYFKKHSSSIDFSLHTNTEQVLAYINQYWENDGIKQEIAFIRAVTKEIEELNQKDPNGVKYRTNPRLKELLKLADEIVDIDPVKIKAISYKYYVYLDGTPF